MRAIDGVGGWLNGVGGGGTWIDDAAAAAAAAAATYCFWEKKLSIWHLVLCDFWIFFAVWVGLGLMEDYCLRACVCVCV